MGHEIAFCNRETVKLLSRFRTGESNLLLGWLDASIARCHCNKGKEGGGGEEEGGENEGEGEREEETNEAEEMASNFTRDDFGGINHFPETLPNQAKKFLGFQH